MSGTKTLIQQYFQYQQDIEAKYGEKSLVLMMVGSFYEVYGLEVGQDKVSAFFWNTMSRKSYWS